MQNAVPDRIFVKRLRIGLIGAFSVVWLWLWLLAFPLIFSYLRRPLSRVVETFVLYSGYFPLEDSAGHCLDTTFIAWDFASSFSSSSSFYNRWISTCLHLTPQSVYWAASPQWIDRQSLENSHPIMRVRIITTIFTALSALFVVFRLFTRVKLVKKWGYDDLLIVASWLCSATFYAFIVVGEFENH